ncbi:hypothetical protein DM806_02065 [Sphingobium lactosutens]|uniref:SphA family protein n=1 Tax=Sphingobium lactosutens TaxID=522773 RepID=UPI0015BF66AD|nr:transporter [Sphingobium lactosutens]NWK94483.1 hypothetical protein [Sphingobium lactosutens]
MRKYALALAAAFAAVAASAQATETGGGAYPNGAESIGVARLPPPGTYLLGYSTYYAADRLNDAHGDSAVPDFAVDAFANIARFVRPTDKRILGATCAMQTFVPVVDLTVHAAGARQHKFGPGDMIVNPFMLGWTKGNLNIIATMDTYVPTGRYRKGDLANIGCNYWTFEPVLAVTYADPKGGPEVSAKIMYDFNTKNKATDYRSGQEFHADVAAAYNFNPLTIGVTAYYYKQTSDDRQNGLRVGPDGNRGEACAAGPLLRYQLGHVPITAQWQHEFHAENRPQGAKFWLKAAFRF